ncbi:alpha/beta fold hydrolase [Paenibacillus campinasensis]|uniref:Alpha/beta fold hydrolase n=1 Tax=Paenibacillus campinasensis TaxID=66347 RepID=A0ABW9T1T9_9BACL|nr:alpha/beta hydrolase [Paenibacillus campinasensis]MUG67268.1 alpha/beta fold hydrolase [Paenibacillus campinasensis]
MLSAIIILCTIMFILVAASFYFYQVGVARAEKDFLEGNPDLAANADVEDPFAGSKEWWSAQRFESWSQVSEDGLKLHAYYLPAKTGTDRTVILAHGYSGHAEQMSSFAQIYHEDFGYNVLLPDARGHGLSEGHYIGFGWPERKDIVKWIRLVMERTGANAQIVLHGVSMGAATVMMASGEPLPSNVKAIIEDCGYTSVRDQLRYQLKRMYRLPAFPLLQTTSLLTKLRAGYFFGEASALTQVRQSKTPILFIHGSGDLFVPVDMGYELYENGPAEKRLFIVPDAGHAKALSFDPEGYQREIAEFLAAYVSTRPQEAEEAGNNSRKHAVQIQGAGS